MKKSIAVIFIVLLLAACGPRQAVSNTPVQTATPDHLLYKDPDQPVDVRVEDLLSRMTQDEKIAQMVQPVQQGIPATDVDYYFLGSVLSTAGSISETNSLQDWTNIPRTYIERALTTGWGSR